MRLRLSLPRVAPEQRHLPATCPRRGCGGQQFKCYQRRLPKRVVDRDQSHVAAERWRCVRCDRTFRVYPVGVSRAHHSAAIAGLGVMLYVLGLSYRGVEDVLSALGWPVARMTVYRDVQAAGERVQQLRQARRAAGGVPVRVLGVDLTRVACRGKQIAVGVAVDDTTGVDLEVRVLAGEDAATLLAWVQELAAAVGAEVVLTDDANVFPGVVEALGLGQQVCRAHVLRHVGATVDALVAAVEAGGLSPPPLGVSATSDQVLADIAAIDDLIHGYPHDGAEQLAGLHRRYQAAPGPKPGETASLWYRLRLWTLDLSESWGRFTLYQRWRGPDGQRMDGTNNSTERAIGWSVKDRYRTMRGYKRARSVENVGSLTGWLRTEPPRCALRAAVE